MQRAKKRIVKKKQEKIVVDKLVPINVSSYLRAQLMEAITQLNIKTCTSVSYIAEMVKRTGIAEMNEIATQMSRHQKGLDEAITKMKSLLNS